jgi:hypothetical protein
MDTGQIEQQMTDTRARIDRKLEVLTLRTQRARQRGQRVAMGFIGVAAMAALVFGITYSRRRRKVEGRRVPLSLAR